MPGKYSPAEIVCSHCHTTRIPARSKPEVEAADSGEEGSNGEHSCEGLAEPDCRWW